MMPIRPCTVLLAVTLIVPAAAPVAAQNVDWRLHNLDLHGSRYAEIDQITPENAHRLTPRWLFQHGVIDGVSNQTTPVVVDGVMYLTDSRGSVYAVDAYDGHHLWTYDVTDLLGGGRREGYIFRHRGVTYEDGVVYSAAGSFIFALDAETGQPIETFGDNGQASVILDVLRLRYPDVETAISMGYWFTTAPQIHEGVIYVGTTRSESLIPGGHVLAVDAATGEVIWHFNTIPQDENDQGWDIAGPTWVGNVRTGGGIWETPSLDPELGLLYVAVGNPFGDSTERDGMNLFTDSVLALDIENGQLRWYYQLVHHDVWDYDNGSQPILFDMEADGEPVRALGQANKNAFLYLLNRETGAPIHSIIETPVPTETDREGEEPWPTQPIPHKADGERMEPVAPHLPRGDPARARRREDPGANLHADRPQPDLRARLRRRGQLRADGLQRGFRPALRERHRPAVRRRPRAAHVLLGLRPDHRRADLASDPRGLRTGGTGGDLGRGGLRRDRQQHRRLLLRLRRADRRGVVAVQHGSGSLFVARGLHGQRRAVRHRGVRRGRPGPARRGPDPELRAAEAGLSG